MAKTYTSNWINNVDNLSDAALKTLEKLAKREKKRIRNGWRWIRLSQRTKVFVPCYKNGEPTEDGRRIIEEAKKTCI